MIIFKSNLFMHKKRIKTNIFGVSLKRQALYPHLRPTVPKNYSLLLASTTAHIFWKLNKIS